jgi:hypothetical protein
MMNRLNHEKMNTGNKNEDLESQDSIAKNMDDFDMEIGPEVNVSKISVQSKEGRELAKMKKYQI